jgi:hypothetical protein
MSNPLPQEAVMTAVDARARLQELQAERFAALEAGLGGNGLFMASLQQDIAASHRTYVGLAVTEIATFRAQLSGAQQG